MLTALLASYRSKNTPNPRKSMKCYAGIPLNEGIVPCGQCMACRINKARKWTARILIEEAFHPHPCYCWFVTLTYDDKHVPRTHEDVQSLRKREFQTWLSNTNRDSGPFRYYAVGEYGDMSLRPHYHLAIFPHSDSQIGKITERWKNGFTSAYPLTPERAGYLAQYATKKLTKNNDARLSADQEPEFRCSSRIPPLGASIVPALVHRYSRGAGKKIVQERGDIERSIRIGSKIYPLAEILLTKVRKELGIPLLHRERLIHGGYSEWHDLQEAECDLEAQNLQELVHHAKKKAVSLRYDIQKV